MAGVAMTPAIAGDRNRQTNDVDCPAMSPSSDRSETREGGLALQLPGIGINGNRSRARSESDVIIRHDGTETKMDHDLFVIGCNAIVKQYPGQPLRQFQEIERVRNSLRRDRPQAARPIFDVSATGRQTSASETSMNPKQSTTAYTVSKEDASKLVIAAWRGNDAASSNAVAVSPSMEAAPITFNVSATMSSCGQTGCGPTSEAAGEQTPPQSQPRKATMTYRASADQHVPNQSHHAFVPTIATTAVRTCMTASEVLVPAPSFRTGNMIFVGSPTYTGGGTTCTTTFGN